MRQALTICPNRHSRRDRQDRLAFTLVELLVVMTIIIVLMGLSLAGVQRIRTKAREIKVRNDISQLSAALQSFKANKQVAFVPSRIRLRNNLAAYLAPVDQLDIDSLAYLKKVWPRISAVFDNTNPNTNMRSLGWFPTDPNAGPGSAYELQGWQAMVFFLGGIQVNNQCLGFSTNPSNPTLLTFRMEQPYFDFPSDRLNYSAGNFAPLGFTDPFGTVYAYFSSVYGNDYLRYSSLPFQNAIPAVGASTAYSDCASLNVFPYFDNSSGVAVCYNRDGFQIISAGKNGQDPSGGFGPGGQWSAALGYPAGSPGADDFSNFSATNLGTGSQVQ